MKEPKPAPPMGGALIATAPVEKGNIFLITIEHRESCQLHARYSEYLNRLEEQRKEVERKRLEEQELRQK